MNAGKASLRSFDALAISDPADLVFGRAPRPVRCGFDLTIGAGQVYPEVNFTLPAISVSPENWKEILVQYEEMAAGIVRRAIALRAPGIVLEFELLPAMTEKPEWGAEITAMLHGTLRQAYEQHGLASALRVTPTDIREQGKPPSLRSGNGSNSWYVPSNSVPKPALISCPSSRLVARRSTTRRCSMETCPALFSRSESWPRVTWRGFGTRLPACVRITPRWSREVTLPAPSPTPPCSWRINT